RHARRAHPSAGHRQRERKRTRPAHHAVVVPDGKHAFRGQDTRERRDLILVRSRAPEVMPDRAHRRPHLLHRPTNPNLPIHPTPHSRRTSPKRSKLSPNAHGPAPPARASPPPTQPPRDHVRPTTTADSRRSPNAKP